jgi:hypothetical protein
MADQTATVLQHCQQGFPGLPMLLGLPGYIRRTAHSTPKPRAIIEPPGIQAVQVFADDRKQPGEVSLRASRIRVELDLWHLGFHKSAATHKQKSPAFCGLPRQTWSKRPSITVQRVGLKAIIIGRLR